MAVQLDFLEPDIFARNLAENKYLYKDLYLDLETSYVKGNSLLSPNDFGDLKALYDTDSVFQSLNNIFNTLPGQKLLNPTFGLDLRSYLFQPANTRVGYVIGLEITRKLPTLEPRVSISNVYVTVLADELSYVVDIYFRIPSLEIVPPKTFNMKVKFNSNGFTII